MSDVKEEKSWLSRITIPEWMKRSKKQLTIAVGSLVFIGVAAFAGNQYVTANTVEFYKVYMDGKEIGTVNNKALVDQLVTIKTKEVEQKYPGVHMALNADKITYAADKQYKPTVNSNETIDKLSNLLVPTATGVSLKINGKVVGVVKDQETADTILAKVKSKYQPQSKAATKQVKALSVKSTSAATTPTKTKMSRVESVGFVEKVATEDTQVDPSKILTAEESYNLLAQGEISPIKYTVKDGDTISGIAHKFNVSQGVIYNNNPKVDEFNLKIGMNLDLTVSKPALTVSIVEKVTENIVIEPLTEIRTDPSMRAGQTKVVREGKSGLKQMSYMLTKHNGDLVIEQWLGQKVITPAVSKIIVRGTKVVVGEGSGNFAWPVSSASISSPYGTRWGRMHKGIDITGNHNVKASDDGVVSFAGTKSGYGNVIIINHKNGYETLYGHLDSFKVKKGAVVEKGQAIAIMGNTGRSTGTHLHFEIHKNGSLRNPMSFL